MLPVSIFLANVACTWFMVGLIWFVQVVHYPGFRAIGGEQFPVYHRRHTRRTTWVVLGPMLVELATSIALVVIPVTWMPIAWAWIGLALVAVVWLSTFVLQVPAHGKLSGGLRDDDCSLLCRTNWIRTIAWTARGLLMLLAAGRVLRGTGGG